VLVLVLQEHKLQLYIVPQIQVLCQINIWYDFQGKKFQDLLSLLPLESIELNRQLVILKASFALMQLYVERGEVTTLCLF
jgi:hypothetical protein